MFQSLLSLLNAGFAGPALLLFLALIAVLLMTILALRGVLAHRLAAVFIVAVLAGCGGMESGTENVPAPAVSPAADSVASSESETNQELIGDENAAAADVGESQEKSVEPKSLHKAAEEGDLMAVQRLIDEGADVESRVGPRGYVSDESQRQDMGIFRSAESYGVDESTPDVDVVFYYGSHEIPYRVIRKADIDGAVVGVGVRSERGEGQQGTSLHWAARGNARNVIALLVERGANLESLTKSLQTPLHWAARADAPDAIAELISRGANFEARTKPQSLRVVSLVSVGGRELVGDIMDLDGLYTPLHAAVKANAVKAVSVLLENGANPEAQDNFGYTPLHSAILNRNRDIAFALIKHGANVGKTHVELAVSLDSFALADEIQKKATQQREISQEKPKVEFATAETEAGGVFESIWRSVVVVEAGNSQGSGVVLKPNLVATNCHVTDAATSPIAVFKGENRRADKSQSHPARVVAGDRKRDVCLLEVSGLWAIPAETRKAAEMKIAEQVYAVGAPKGLDFSISGGLVSQLRGEDAEGNALAGSAPLIQTDTAISPGSSGGGLFDAQGRLVGLTTFAYRDSEGLNFAVPIEWAMELIPAAE